jgi:hypothetical protein
MRGGLGETIEVFDNCGVRSLLPAEMAAEIPAFPLQATPRLLPYPTPTASGVEFTHARWRARSIVACLRAVGCALISADKLNVGSASIGYAVL